MRGILLAGLLLAVLPSTASAERLAALIASSVGPATLLTFDSATPETVRQLTVGGVPAASHVLRSIDVRPLSGQLYAVAASAGMGSTSPVHTYVIDPDSGVAGLAGSTAAGLTGWSDGVSGSDFHPGADRLRIVNVDDENARIHPSGALTANDTDLSGGTILDVAYDRNVPGTTATTAFALNGETGSLARIGGIDGNPSSNGGTVTDIGPLGVTLVPDLAAGFDISGATGTAYAALSTSDGGNATRLYRINLATGAATLLGTIGPGTAIISGLTVLPDLPAGPAGPMGPAGATGQTGPQGAPGTIAGKLAVAIALSAHRGRAGKALRVRIVSTLGGLATLSILRKGKRVARVADTVAAGRSVLRFPKLPGRGAYTLRLAVTAGSQTARDTGTLRVGR